MVNTLPLNALYYGHQAPLPQQLALRAGPLALIYEAGTLRRIMLGEALVVQQIYAAVRDQDWATPLPSITLLEQAIGPRAFRLRFESEHRQGNIHFVWTGTISGDEDGTITFHFAGVARSTFRRNRIGFCVLHPAALAGQPCTVRHADGTVNEGHFPLHIAPHQPFKDLRAITHEVLPGVQAEVTMQGDIFEMEDQRNWTDASYKTYCTPLALPVEVAAGTTIDQTVTLRLHGAVPDLPAYAPPAPSFAVTHDTAQTLPEIGLCATSQDEPLTALAIQRLKALNLVYLRADLYLAEPDAASALRRASREAGALGIGLEIALHLTDNAEAELRALGAALKVEQPPVIRWLIFHQRENSTTRQWVELARRTLGEAAGAPFAGSLFAAGSLSNFTELNRGRPPLDVLDAVCYALNPQVHAFDNLTLVENLPVQGLTVENARRFCPGKPLLVGPVTLRKRAAHGVEEDAAPTTLPASVDVRQMSLFGAGWTLGSIKALAGAGAHSISYYETAGWRGVMERAAGSPLPEQFRSIPGGVFPLYHVLAWVGDFAGGEVLAAQPSDPLRVTGLVLRQAGRRRVLLANLTPQAQAVTVSGLEGIGAVKTLDAASAEAAMREPEVFRQQAGESVAFQTAGTVLKLQPFALTCIDAS